MEQNEEMKNMSVLDIFNQYQTTYEDAKAKETEEASRQQAKHFRITSDGTYALRILPNAPVFKEGMPQPLDRKSYEYPIKSLVLKVDNPKDKKKPFFVGICNAKYAGFTTDLIDTYVAAACEKYANDEKLVEKIKKNSFENGLKWNSERVMYVLDNEKRGDGPQLFSLSYSQYKDLEAAKMAAWNKLLKNNQKQQCPISSITEAYNVEIIRSTENKKVSYKIGLDILGGANPLEEKELQALLDSPRIPEAVYRYTRWHLEATIEFLKQYDEKMQIDVMSEESVKEAIEKIKLELPADDNSHFSFDKKKDGEKGGNSNDTTATGEFNIDTLFDRLEALEDKNLNDKSEEGQELREDIRQYVEDNDIPIRISRSKTNRDLLEEIDKALGEEAPAKTPDKEAEKPEEESEEEKPVDESEEEDDNEPAAPARGEHNDDTNEPAVRSDRRSARPEREGRRRR